MDGKRYDELLDKLVGTRPLASVSENLQAFRAAVLREWSEWIVAGAHYLSAPLRDFAGMMRFWIPDTTDEAVWGAIETAAAKSGRFVGREGDLVWFGAKPARS